MGNARRCFSGVYGRCGTRARSTLISWTRRSTPLAIGKMRSSARYAPFADSSRLGSRAPYAARTALRRKLLDAELEAENSLIDTLEALAPERVVGPAPQLPALVALAQAWRPPAPVPALDRLIEAL